MEQDDKFDFLCWWGIAGALAWTAFCLWIFYEGWR